MCYALLIKTTFIQKITPLEKLCLLVSCLGHDLDHPGYNNVYQINGNIRLIKQKRILQLYTTIKLLSKTIILQCYSEYYLWNLAIFSGTYQKRSFQSLGKQLS